MRNKTYKLRPDSKGRICFGKLAEGVSSYTVTVNHDKSLTLEPNIEIPEKESWLFNNKAALNQVKKGLNDSAANRVKSRGSFTQYLDEEE